KDSFVRDFVRANDGWFRPVSTQVGPDGAVWIMDWYDKYPCYQNANADPEGVDRSYGRIWRIVYTGKEKGKPVPSHPEGMNLKKLSTEGLVHTLAHPNSWQRRMAQRILNERQDAAGREPLLNLITNSDDSNARIAAFWTLYSSDQLRAADLQKTVTDRDWILRAWTARLIGERGDSSQETIDLLQKLATDENPSVRVAVTTAIRQLESDALTINTRPEESPAEEFGPPLATVFRNQQSAQDPLIPFMLWMDSEQWFANNPKDVLAWYSEHGLENTPLAAVLLRKGMRRICDTGKSENVEAVIDFMAELPREAGPLALASLEGLIEGQKGHAFTPDQNASALLAKLRANPNPDVAARAQELATIWGDAAALDASLGIIRDSSKPEKERIEAIKSVSEQKAPAVRETLAEVISTRPPEPIATAAITALAQSDNDQLPDITLNHWKEFSPVTRRAAAQVLSSRSKWSQRLLSGIETKSVSMGDVPLTVVRALLTSKDDYVRNRATKIIGRYRETAPDKAKLIAQKKQVVLHGPIDLQKGHEIAQKTCFTCHKLYGEGADVGPDLTGVGRSSLDALLTNIIDPNQIIGAGYENVEVTTKDDRSVSGRLVENTDTRVKLLSLGPKEEVLSKNEIASIRVSEMSVMPEGLEQMPDDDFRNLVWFIYSPPQEKKPVSVEEEREAMLRARSD
ncbi:MAG TPA: HEAT repeat domain-containing protein, partial [Verrucomicrobiae bacterium]|nr:HEAT repeat domain-containing protein [Verrucomicrobiae bacterium]